MSEMQSVTSNIKPSLDKGLKGKLDEKDVESWMGVPEEESTKSWKSSMVPESDKNAQLIMTHIPVQKINNAKYTLPENHEKEWTAGVLIDKPIKKQSLPNKAPRVLGERVKSPEDTDEAPVQFEDDK